MDRLVLDKNFPGKILWKNYVFEKELIRNFKGIQTFGDQFLF